MKKIAFFSIFILGVCFSVDASFSGTGILAGNGESAIGLWGTVKRPLECGECEELKKVELDYMTTFGLEVGVKFGQLGETDIKGLQLNYHLKGRSNILFGISKTELEGESGFSIDGTSYTLGFYNSRKNFYFGISDLNWDIDSDFDADQEIITFGGYIPLGAVNIGISYDIDVDTVDEMFEEEDFEYLKEGVLGIKIGGLF